MKCTKCYGKGKPGGCPKCGTDSEKPIVEQSMDIPVRIQLSDIIPSVYKGVCWRPNDNENNLSIKSVEQNMKKIYSICASGKLPSFSAFISGPIKLNKELFVFSCMQELLVRNFKIVPFVSTVEMRRIIRASQYNPKYKFMSKWTYDDIITSDLLFVTVTHLTEDRHSDLTLIQEVLDTRSRMDKATIFISDYKLESLVSRFDTKEYLLIYNTDKDRDKLKFPFIFQAAEEE